MMKAFLRIMLLGFAWWAAPVWGSLEGDTVTGNLADPYTAQIYSNSTATVGAGEEFHGSQRVGTLGYIIEHYADLDAATITIGVRHVGATGLIFNANPFTYEFGSLDWSGPDEIQDVRLAAAFTNVLWPNATDPNAKWIGWGQDTSVAPLWNPVWNPVNRSVTLAATQGFTIPPGYDVWATFQLVVPEPASVALFSGALLMALLVTGRRSLLADRR